MVKCFTSSSILWRIELSILHNHEKNQLTEETLQLDSSLETFLYSSIENKSENLYHLE
jgi:hypothetical protein